MAREISNSEDVIDSRDVIERIEELESERQDLVDAVEQADEAWKAADAGSDEAVETGDALDNANTELDNWDEENGGELKALKALAEEAEGYSEDWKYGATLIRYDCFTEYAEQLCKDIGDLPQNIPSYIEIDWEKTADNIKADYTSVDFDGVEYWVR